MKTWTNESFTLGETSWNFEVVLDSMFSDGAGATNQFQGTLVLSLFKYFIAPELENLVSEIYIYIFSCWSCYEIVALWSSRLQLLHGMRCIELYDIIDFHVSHNYPLGKI